MTLTVQTDRTALLAIVCLFATVATGCGEDVNTVLEKASRARQSASDLLVDFTKAADAANRAVMAETDEASVAFAKEAEQATDAVEKDAGALGPILQNLHYADETRLLDEFKSRFAEYRALDRRILDLAVENTNLKAQRLSYGPAQEAADAFRDALTTLVPSSPAEAWHVQALAATAIKTVREIQVLQAPHIADADVAVMTRMEKEMATSEMTARDALDKLRPLIGPPSAQKISAASAALDRFMGLNAEIIALSRRNTNVRSLALSLDQKREIVVKCEDTLRSLRTALEKREYAGRR
jgi:rhodanese-related sulfurtransferase